MTKAERIFNATRYACKKYINDWGYETNPDGSSVGFNSMYHKDTESVCIRTVNAIQKILLSKRRFLETNRKLGISTPERLENETQILNMVESTLNNQRRNLEQFISELKAI